MKIFTNQSFTHITKSLLLSYDFNIFIFSIVEKISVSDLSVDYYVGNLHKWAFACKGTGFLWVDPEHQKHIRPLSTCQTHNMKFPREFQSLGQGCNDICTKYIAASDALDFYKRYSFVI